MNDDVSQFLEKFFQSEEYKRIIQRLDKDQELATGDIDIKEEAEIIKTDSAKTLLTDAFIRNQGMFHHRLLIALLTAYHEWLVETYGLSRK